MNKKILNMSIIALLMFTICATTFSYADTTVLKVNLLNQNPSPARAGDTVELAFSVENLGQSPFNDVSFEVISEYPFTSVDAETVKQLGTIYAYQTGEDYVSASFNVMVDKDAKEGDYDLKIRYGSKTEKITKTINISVTSKEYAQIIYVDKSILAPGKETDMSFKITNIGSAPLQNLVFSWSEPNDVILPVFSDNTKYIKSLDVGETADLTYTVVADVNADPGLYLLNLNLDYESASGDVASVISSKAGVFVGGETDFDVAFSQSSQGQTSLSVSNIGNTPALSVSVRVPQQENYRVSGSDTAIIGNLDKGDYTLVSFQISANSNNTMRRFNNDGVQKNISQNQSFQRQNNGLRVLIDYTDTAGKRRTVEKTVSIQFRDASSLTGAASASKQTGFIGSTSFYIIIASLAVIAGYLVYKRKSKKK